jgi:RNA polymerase sigma factor (sigma-70 family)
MDSTVPGPLCRAEELEEACQTDPENCRRIGFEAAWLRHRTILYRYSLRWTNGRQEDAEDALGQVAVVALQTIPSDLTPADERAWLLRLVYTKCMDIYRASKRSRNILQEAEIPAAEVASDSSNLESLVLDVELSIVVQSHVSQLAPRLRAVAELHLLRDLRYGEIAEILAISEENVRKRMQKVRAILREPLRRYLAGDAGAVRCPEKQEHRRKTRTSALWSIEALRKYVRKHPRGWKKRWELASRLRQEGLLEEAVLHYEGAALRQPRQPELWVELGGVLCAVGRPGEAAAAYEKALRWARDKAMQRQARNLLAGCRD